MNGNDGHVLRAIRGPIILITVGVLFALNNFTRYQFDQTWPVILIVFGLLALLRRGTYRHPATGPEPQTWPPQGGYSGSGSYRQSQYPSAPPSPQSEPVKGGFGTSAPPRPENSSAVSEPPEGGKA
jgi:hypothetical protein